MFDLHQAVWNTDDTASETVECTCVLNNKICKLQVTHIRDSYNDFLSDIIVVNDMTDTYEIIEELNMAKEDAEKAVRTLEGLLSLAAKGEVIDEQRVRYLITLVKEGNDEQVT